MFRTQSTSYLSLFRAHPSSQHIVDELMNNAINEIKNALQGTKSRITEAEDRINEVEDRMVEINEAERKRAKKN